MGKVFLLAAETPHILMIMVANTKGYRSGNGIKGEVGEIELENFFFKFGMKPFFLFNKT